jgi:hypothetical protein
MKHIYLFFTKSFPILLAAVIGSQFVTAQAAIQSTPVSIRNADFSDGMAGWSSFARETGALSTVPKDKTLSLVYTGTKDWALSSRTRISVQPNQVFRFTCCVYNCSKNDTAAFYVVTLASSTVVSYSAAKTDFFSGSEWKTYQTVITIPAGADAVYCRFNGKGNTNILIKDIRIEHIPNPTLTRTAAPDETVISDGKFSGILAKRPIEKLGRGVTVVPVVPSGCFVSWRLLETDPTNISFVVSRTSNGSDKTILTEQPITGTTCFTDKKGKIGDTYIVTPVFPSDSTSQSPSGSASADTAACTVIPLSNGYGAEKIAAADLNGDGEYEYILKTPAGSIDPAHHIASRRTYSLEAYRLDGSRIWTKDLGWNIESGLWYSPYAAVDLDGDGKAEVITKTGEDTSKGGKDYRDKTGKVFSGPEYLSVLDGVSGKELIHTDWISRSGFENYTLASYNQLAIAYLDGKTPCIVMVRGIYGLIKAEAYMYVPASKALKTNARLMRIWSFSNEYMPPITKGQGGLTTVCADIDNDGRDEIILGSLILDDDGKLIVNLKQGRTSSIYFGDLDPAHEGNEIALMYDSRLPTGGIRMLDSATGQQLWSLPEATENIYGRGFCADIDKNYPGRELYGMEAGKNRAPSGRRWYLTATGIPVKDAAELNRESNDWSFSPVTAYWNGSGQKTIIDKNILPGRGTVLMSADLFGDWREEIVIATKTDIRIYSTNIESAVRRTTLMSDKQYRSFVTMSGSGMMQCPDTIKPVLDEKR